MTTESLKYFISEAKIACQRISQDRGINITEFDIQIGLCSVLGFKNIDFHEIIDRKLTETEMVDLLVDYKFIVPNILKTVHLRNPIIPVDIPRLLTEKKIKVKGEIWYIHKYDPDTFPSNPHGHNVETGSKLHLGTGELFRPDKTFIGKIDKKRLHAIRSKLKDIELPPLDTN